MKIFSKSVILITEKLKFWEAHWVRRDKPPPEAGVWGWVIFVNDAIGGDYDRK